MTRRAPVSNEDLHRLWAAVEAAVKKQTGPFVSMAKFLHQPDEETAAQYWLGHARTLILAVPEQDVELAPDRGPVLQYANGVAVTFDLSQVTISTDAVPQWRAVRRPLTATVVTDALGLARFAHRWDQLLATQTHQPGPVVYTDDDREFPWIAQNPSVPGPWTSAKTEELAHRAARAEALGPKKIAKLYERMRKRS